jgi:uncharacterized membrane protein YGL010W
MSDIMKRIGLQELVLLGSLALVVVGWILGAIAAGFYAIRLNRSGAWAFLGLVVSPLTVFVLLFGLGPRDDEDDRISCPFCAEDVKPEAILCPHCRSDLSKSRADRLLPRR